MGADPKKLEALIQEVASKVVAGAGVKLGGAGSSAAAGVAEDIEAGFIDRLRSLPIPRRRAAPVTSAIRPSKPSSLIDTRDHSLGTDPNTKTVEGDGTDEERAAGDVLVERIDAGEGQTVVEDSDDQEPDGSADDRPSAAAQARTAEDDRRDHG